MSTTGPGGFFATNENPPTTQAIFPYITDGAVFTDASMYHLASRELMQMNAKLSSELATMNTKLIAALENQVQIPPRRLTNMARKKKAPKLGTHYCWTHGYDCPHNSVYCPNPALNHDKNATVRDRKGGSEENRT